MKTHVKEKKICKIKKKKKNATYRNLKNAITAYKNSNNKNKFTQESLKLLMAFFKKVQWRFFFFQVNIP